MFWNGENNSQQIEILLNKQVVNIHILKLLLSPSIIIHGNEYKK